jgi:hypothetical protein
MSRCLRSRISLVGWFCTKENIKIEFDSKEFDLFQLTKELVVDRVLAQYDAQRSMLAVAVAFANLDSAGVNGFYASRMEKAYPLAVAAAAPSTATAVDIVEDVDDDDDDVTHSIHDWFCKVALLLLLLPLLLRLYLLLLLCRLWLVLLLRLLPPLTRADSHCVAAWSSPSTRSLRFAWCSRVVLALAWSGLISRARGGCVVHLARAGSSEQGCVVHLARAGSSE